MMRHARSVLVRWCKCASLAGEGDEGDKTGRGFRSGKVSFENALEHHLRNWSELSQERLNPRALQSAEDWG